MSAASRLAATLVDELIRTGLRDAVLSPGSRNAPLSYALSAAADAGRLRLHVRLDERSAGFLALGIAKASGRPVAVCTTSGTAPAHLHPAALEAGESGVPLLLLTADRPPELRGTGANQTVDQHALYPGALRLFAELICGEPDSPGYWRSVVDRVVGAARGTLSGDPGPAQLNVALREPLAPDGPIAVAGAREGQAPWTELLGADPPAPPPLESGFPRTVVLVGDAPAALGRAARRLAEQAGWPLFAEPTSGARGGPNLVSTYAWLLQIPELVAELAPQRVLVVGRPTLHRQVGELTRTRVEVRVAGPRWADAGRVAARVGLGLPEHAPETADPGWLDAWARAERAARIALDAALNRAGMDELRLASDLAAALEPGAPLVVGSSLPIRDLDLAAGPLDHIPVFANRGVSGIDGTVSTAAGVAIGTGEQRAVALVGDLTFLHDAGGLFRGAAEPGPAPDLCLVVLDNGGGGVFGLLEPAGGDARTFDRLFRTRQDVDLAPLAAAAGAGYREITRPEELPEALAGSGTRVVHARVREPTAAARAQLRDAVRDAVRGAV